MFLSVMVKGLAQKTTEMKKKTNPKNKPKQTLVSFMHFEAGHKHEKKNH